MIDGFDSPVGTPDERAGAQVWPGAWIDVNPIFTRYELGFHTGADLNLPGDADAHTTIHAVSAGAIVFAQRVMGNWGNLIVIKHAGPVYSRYGHVENICVKRGESVVRGQPIAQVGNAYGRWAFHLHFDISTHPTRLNQEPYDWSANTEAQVRSIYVDPREFILSHRPIIAPPNALWVIAPSGLNLRNTPAGAIIRTVPCDTPVTTGRMQVYGDIVWVETQLPTGEQGWLAAREGSDLYLARQPRGK